MHTEQNKPSILPKSTLCYGLSSQQDAGASPRRLLESSARIREKLVKLPRVTVGASLASSYELNAFPPLCAQALADWPGRLKESWEGPVHCGWQKNASMPLSRLLQASSNRSSFHRGVPRGGGMAGLSPAREGGTSCLEPHNAGGYSVHWNPTSKGEVVTSSPPGPGCRFQSNGGRVWLPMTDSWALGMGTQVSVSLKDQ